MAQEEFPPSQAPWMVGRWEELGRPPIPLDQALPGYTVTDLGKFFKASENAQMFRVPRVHRAILGFLCDARHYRRMAVWARYQSQAWPTMEATA
jgi:hypothetical protein